MLWHILQIEWHQAQMEACYRNYYYSRIQKHMRDRGSVSFLSFQMYSTQLVSETPFS